MVYDFSSFEEQIKATFDHLLQDLAGLRTGKASVQMLDPVKVEAYGTYMKLTEVADIRVPDPSQILISPWDKSLLGAIEKGIQISGINLNPVVDGQSIRISVPPLTEERRLDMVKLLSQKIEAGRVMVRNVRTDIKKEIDKQKGQPGISEDAIEADLAELEKRCQHVMVQVEKLSKDKEKELMTI
jgi:ribosome recycling factor